VNYKNKDIININDFHLSNQNLLHNNDIQDILDNLLDEDHLEIDKSYESGYIKTVKYKNKLEEYEKKNIKELNKNRNNLAL